MQTFLSEVAQRLYAKYGNDISSLSVMFSSRRARLFFADALSGIADRPIWEPEYLSMDDLMGELLSLQSADKIRLVTELYRVYSRYHKEPFDKFYFWGELLLADFDMIDKYMIDASQLFRNISDIKELEADVSYLTPEQLRIISEFWSTIGEEKEWSEQKRRFLAVWRTLGTIYEEYRERLRSLGIGYTGMIYREAIGRIERGEVQPAEARHYVVAGFNALSTCERRLLDYLSKNYDTDFFWDYDDYYVDNKAQEAGMFVRQSLRELPPADGISHDNLRNIASLHVVSTDTNVAQCKYAVSVLRELAKKGKLDKETAVVLTDENLLMPLLYALPNEEKNIGSVNVTMGYPLSNTLAYSFVERLLELQNHARMNKEGECAFYYADVDGLLTHPYVADIDKKTIASIRDNIVRNRLISVPQATLAATPLLARLFRRTESWNDLLNYLCDALAVAAEIPYNGDEVRFRTEYLSVTAQNITQLRNMLLSCEMEISVDVCRALVHRHLQSVRIPFKGEPLEGLQVMGILETRNLDFRNVLILSMTDDNFPGARTADSSFIPYNLRFAYGLPTPEHHEGVYAYYFYRLIQRAENVYMFYCSHADEKGTGEPSRYIRQLEYETSFPISYTEVGADVNMLDSEPVAIRKDAGVADVLASFTDGRSFLSPTAFSRYVQCPLKFYFASVAKIRTDDELTDEVDNATFGNIFHKAAELFYANVIDEEHPAEHLKKLLESDAVERAVDAAICRVYFGREDDVLPELSGDLTIVRDIVCTYLRNNVVPYDIAHNDFVVLSTERDVAYDFPFTVGGEQRLMRFKGISDRVDSLGNGLLRVVDYKTGPEHLDFNGLEQLFHGEAKQGQSNIINTLLYAMMLSHECGRDALPALYYVRKMNDSGYSPLFYDKSLKRKGVPYSEYANEFEGYVAEMLAEIFDLSKPFTQCEDDDVCQWCDFADICARGKQ